MRLFDIIFVLLVHTGADFILQGNWMALGKSKSWKPLLAHGAVYSIATFLMTFLYIIFMRDLDASVTRGLFWYILLTLTSHVALDYFTSRMSSKMRDANDFGGKWINLGFFAVIGVDQAIHLIQLFICWKIFIG